MLIRRDTCEKAIQNKSFLVFVFSLKKELGSRNENPKTVNRKGILEVKAGTTWWRSHFFHLVASEFPPSFSSNQSWYLWVSFSQMSKCTAVHQISKSCPFLFCSTFPNYMLAQLSLQVNNKLFLLREMLWCFAIDSSCTHFALGSWLLLKVNI